MSANGLKSTPRMMDIALTGRCNLKCEYCFYADEMVALGDLPTERWLAFFEELRELGVMEVTLTGGEVFTRSDLFEIIDGIIANRMRYTLLTNGTLITEKTLEQFNVGKRKTRLNTIQISIDGSTAEVHNKSRPNSFERSLRGLKLLKEAEIPLTVRVTINRFNYQDLENTARLLLEDVGLPWISTNAAMPMGAGCSNQGRIALTATERLEAMHIIEQLLERYPNRILANAGPQALIQRYAAMEEARATGDTHKVSWTMGTLSACGCTFNKLSVLHDGNIVPCMMLPELVLGQIGSADLYDIWHNHPILDEMRSRRSISMHDVPGCKGCEWASYCNGGCPGLAFELTRELNVADPTDCYRRFIKETGQRYVAHC